MMGLTPLPSEEAEADLRVLALVQPYTFTTTRGITRRRFEGGQLPWQVQDTVARLARLRLAGYVALDEDSGLWHPTGVPCVATGECSLRYPERT